MKSKPKALWDPKFAAAGVLAIAAAIFVLDFLPGIISRKLSDRIRPPEMEPPLPWQPDGKGKK